MIKRFALVCSAALCQLAVAGTAPTGPDAFDRIVTSLADHSAFRMTSADLDALLAPFCKKTSDRAFETMIVRRYSCSSAAGLAEIRMDSREGFVPPLPNYMMTISVDFSIDKYAGVKTQIEKKLGRGKQRSKDFIEWRYGADKALNEAGNPVINLSRDSSDHSASLHVALEQGP